MPKYRITLEDGTTQIIEADEAPRVGDTHSDQGFQGNPARSKRQDLMRQSGAAVTSREDERDRHAGSIEEGLAQTNPIARTSLGGVVQAGTGGQQMANGEYAKGGSNLIRGVGQAMAPAALPVGIATAPAAMAMGAAGGMAGEGLGQGGAALMGANPDQQALAGDIGGLLGGGYAVKRGAPPIPSVPAAGIAKAIATSPKARNAAIDMLPKGKEGRKLSGVISDIIEQYRSKPGQPAQAPQVPPQVPQGPHPLAVQPNPIEQGQPIRPWPGKDMAPAPTDGGYRSAQVSPVVSAQPVQTPQGNAVSITTEAGQATNPQTQTIPFAKETPPPEVFKTKARTERAPKTDALADLLHQHGVSADEIASIKPVQWRDMAKALNIELPQSLEATIRETRNKVFAKENVKKTSMMEPSKEMRSALSKPGVLDIAKKLADSLSQ